MVPPGAGWLHFWHARVVLLGLKMKPIIIYVHTEFTGIKANLNHSQLISIGLVDETGTKTFYAEQDGVYTREQCCPFVFDEILPLLDAPNLSGELAYSSIYAKMTADQIREHLIAWFKQFDKPIELRSDYPDFEWHFVNRLFAGQPCPENLLAEVNHCCPTANPMQLLRYYQRVEMIFDKEKFRRHHALDDAKVMRLAMLDETLRSNNN